MNLQLWYYYEMVQKYPKKPYTSDIALTTRHDLKFFSTYINILI